MNLETEHRDALPGFAIHCPISGFFVPQFPSLYTGDNNSCCFLHTSDGQSRTGEKENVFGPLERAQPGRCVFFCLFFFNKFIYLFLAALGLRCCTRAFSSCGERGLPFVVVRGLLTVVASLVAEHGL